MSTLKKWKRKLKKFFNKPEVHDAWLEVQREFRDFLRDKTIVAVTVKTWIKDQLVVSGIASEGSVRAITYIWDAVEAARAKGKTAAAATLEVAMDAFRKEINDPDAREKLIYRLVVGGFSAVDAKIIADVAIAKLNQLVG